MVWGDCPKISQRLLILGGDGGFVCRLCVVKTEDDDTAALLKSKETVFLLDG